MTEEQSNRLLELKHKLDIESITWGEYQEFIHLVDLVIIDVMGYTQEELEQILQKEIQ